MLIKEILRKISQKWAFLHIFRGKPEASFIKVGSNQTNFNLSELSSNYNYTIILFVK